MSLTMINLLNTMFFCNKNAFAAARCSAATPASTPTRASA